MKTRSRNIEAFDGKEGKAPCDEPLIISGGYASDRRICRFCHILDAVW